jgi:hypothetical protein
MSSSTPLSPLRGHLRGPQASPTREPSETELSHLSGQIFSPRTQTSGSPGTYPLAVTRALGENRSVSVALPTAPVRKPDELTGRASLPSLIKREPARRNLAMEQAWQDGASTETLPTSRNPSAKQPSDDDLVVYELEGSEDEKLVPTRSVTFAPVQQKKDDDDSSDNDSLQGNTPFVAPLEAHPTLTSRISNLLLPAINTKGARQVPQ